MSIKINRVDLGRDRQVVLNTLTRCLTPSVNDRRFEWLYGQNPEGEPRAWLALDGANDLVMGAAAAFPRRFVIGNKQTRGWVLGDFCLEPRYRSLGPALQLQRACLEVLEDNQSGFCYDFPSASMAAVYKRLGFNITGEMFRLAKPLRIDRKVKQIIKNPSARRVVASLGNTLLKIADATPEADESVEISCHYGFCDDEFTVLAEEQGSTVGICLRRSAGYLNWRYVNNPLGRYEILTARRGGRLAGYIVWNQDEEDAFVVDMFGEKDAVIMRCLVTEVMAGARKRGVMTLSVSLNEAHPWLPLFSELGFRIRDSVPVVIILSNNFSGKVDSKLTGWYLMQGDRDS